jgi:ferredoxin
VDVVVTDRCQGCGACLLTCPEHALRPLPRRSGQSGQSGQPDEPVPPITSACSADDSPGPLLVVGGLCTGCLECVEICPADAIEVRVLAAEEDT